MRYILITLFVLLSFVGLAQNFSYNGYIYSGNGLSINFPVKLYARTSGTAAAVASSEQFGISNGSTWITRNTYNSSPNLSTTYNYSVNNAFTITTSSGTATITNIITNIPSDRGRGATALWTSANADEGSAAITFPAGYTRSFLGTNYTNGHVNANSWFTFGTTSSSGYQGSATNPAAPTIHIGSVDNSFSDNNMSYLSSETYTDTYYGEVFRVRYEGNANYSSSGINTIWDLYFVKNNPSLMLLVWRQFTTDGSSTSSGATPPGPWTLQATSYTNTSGYYSFSTVLGVSAYEFYIQLDVVNPTIFPTSTDIINVGNIVLKKITPVGRSYYLYDINNDGIFTISDMYYIGALKWAKFIMTPKIFTTTEWASISALNTNPKPTYPGVTSLTLSNPTSGGSTNYYIITPGFSGNINY
jgi:hypothetical protein